MTLRPLPDASVPTYRAQHGGDFEIWKDATDGWTVTRYARLPPEGLDDVVGHKAGFASLSQAVLAILGNSLDLGASPPPPGPVAYEETID